MCFFFQAEDGIRDRLVTGVQTCALPICWVLLNFDVDRYGVVAPSSIKVMEAHPLHVFDEVSISTIGKFKFSARRINGEAVSSDDSKYIFRFKLDYLTIFDPIAITM